MTLYTQSLNGTLSFSGAISKTTDSTLAAYLNPLATTTNLSKYSQAFSHWATNTAAGTGTVTDNAYTSPDGTTDADSLTTASNNWGIFENFSAVIGVTYTVSIYVQWQSGGTTWQVGTDGANVDFNVSSGTYISGSNSTHSITSVGNGWYRYSVTFVATTASPAFVFYSENGTTSSTIAAWGTQAEIGLVANAYVPTPSNSTVSVNNMYKRTSIPQTATIWSGDRRGLLFDGSQNYMTSTTSQTNPQTFSLAIWFRTNTTKGGKIIGFGNAQTGASSSDDRHIWIANNGTINFGCYTGSVIEVATSVASYNDGQWHLAVATIGSGGMDLYVDNAAAATNTNTVAQTYNGYWRLAYDNLANWGTNTPSDFFFYGELSNAHVYSRVLSSSEVTGLFSGTEPSTSGLVSWWLLNGNVNDSSGNNNTGILEGSPQPLYIGSSTPALTKSTAYLLAGQLGFARINLITNPSFEGTGLWTSANYNGTYTHTINSSNYSLYGSYSGGITGNTTAGGGYWEATVNNLVIGQTYTLSAYAYLANWTSGTVYVAACSVGLSIQIGGSAFGTANTWVRGSLTFVAFATSMVMVLDRPSGTTDVYWDGVLLEASGSIGSYFDGSLTGAAWNGTANASTSTYYFTVFNKLTSYLHSAFLSLSGGDRINLVTNPSFEVSGGGWTITTYGGSSSSQITYPSADYALYGSYSAKVTQTGTGNTYLYQTVTVVPGQTYTFSAYIYGITLPAGATIAIYDTTAAHQLAISNSTTTTGSWVRLSCSYTIPYAGVPYGVYNQVHLVLNTIVMPSSALWYWDGILFESSASVNSYFDGSIIPAIWSGAANISTSILTSIAKLIKVPLAATLNFVGFFGRIVAGKNIVMLIDGTPAIKLPGKSRFYIQLLDGRTAIRVGKKLYMPL